MLLTVPAVVLRPPQAALVACGAKLWETRGGTFPPAHRGPLLILASANWTADDTARLALDDVQAALRAHFGKDEVAREDLVTGGIACIAQLTDVVNPATEAPVEDKPREVAFGGQFTAEHFALRLESPRLPNYLHPVHGQNGFFPARIPNDLFA